MTYIVWPNETATAAELGGKARALADLEQDRLPIPPWFVMTPDAFYDSLTVGQRLLLEAGDVRGLATAVRGEIRLDIEPLYALTAALSELCPNGEPVAVRSSANEEDGSDYSFAGQFDSFLFVPGTLEAVAERAAAVWRSAFSQRVLTYREQHGRTGMPNLPSVLIQRMVDADRAGVAFGADPVSGRRSIAVVAAVWGLGTSLVSGESNADTFHVDRSGAICFRKIAVKRTAHCAAPERPDGIEAVAVPEEESERPVLSDEQVCAIADLVRQAGVRACGPRDIEWAIEAGKLFLLQSRPITALGGLADPDGARNLWDNSNIAESYNGITTPLTFSFARRAYAEVYRRMCATLGVSHRDIAANNTVFRNMLGLIRGRVYYNLLNWYRLLVMLPGYASNRAFMEQMMGVREVLPPEIAAELTASRQSGAFWDRLRMAVTAAGLIANYIALPWKIRRFHSDLDAALAPTDPPLSAMRIDELASLYRGMEERLLPRWDPPLVNDLFAMIFFGLLGKLTAKWCGDTDGTVRNDLVRGKGGMISAEPAHRVREMASMLSDDREMSGLLQCGTVRVIRAAIARRPAFAEKYHAYLEKFGDRCIEELKLESPTLNEDPTPLNRAIGGLPAGNNPSPQSMKSVKSADSPPLLPPLSASSADKVPPLNRPLFNWVLRNARNRVRDRENLRFERTRLFGRVRQIFREIGKRLAADGLLSDARDIFYLEVEEILGFIEGTATCTDLKGLAAVRKAEFDRYGSMDSPGDRFETRGAVPIGNSFRSASGVPAPEAGGSESTLLRGLPCCQGIVRARVRVIRDPRTAEIAPGSILVAERTDPGWVILFSAAAGLLVERGSLLSHSAIVAREMAIPAIVSIPGLMNRLADGDLVEMDGTAGTIRILNSADKADIGKTTDPPPTPGKPEENGNAGEAQPDPGASSDEPSDTPKEGSAPDGESAAFTSGTEKGNSAGNDLPVDTESVRTDSAAEAPLDRTRAVVDAE